MSAPIPSTPTWGSFTTTDAGYLQVVSGGIRLDTGTEPTGADEGLVVSATTNRIIRIGAGKTVWHRSTGDEASFVFVEIA